MNPGAPGFFVWIYGGRECRCGQGFREGNGKLVRQRDVASIRGESRTPEGEDIGPGNNALSRDLSCITPPPQQPEPISSPSG